MDRRQFILNTSALCLTVLTGACTTASPANTFTDWQTASPASATFLVRRTDFFGLNISTPWLISRNHYPGWR